MTSIALPWPDKALSPNARGHWAARAKAVKKAREAAHWACIEVGLQNVKASGASLRYTFCPGDKRARDMDNLIAMMKPYQDGIADATGINDRFFTASYGVAVDPSFVGVKVEVIAQ